jgi:hypothetical protein
MKPVTVKYELLVNLQNYENEKICIELQIDEGDGLVETLAYARELAYDCAQSPLEHHERLQAARRARWDRDRKNSDPAPVFTSQPDEQPDLPF